MRKALAITFACALFSIIGSGTALANHTDNDAACPPSSPKGQGAPPCGQGERGNQGNGEDPGDRGNACPPASPNAGGTPPCGNGGNGGDGNGGGGNGGGVQPPEGNCQRADLVVLEDAKLVCVFLGENAEFATKQEDCKDALIALGPVVPDVLGACVFLPPPDEN